MSDEGRNGRGQQATERGEDSFPIDLERTVTLEIGNPNGEVIVRGTDRADLLIRHLKHGVPGSPAYDGAELLIEAEGNRVTVRPVLPPEAGWAGGGFAFDSGGFAGFNPFKGGLRVEGGRVAAAARQAFAGAAGQGVWYDLEIEVPRPAADTSVAVATASGNVGVEAIAGRIQVRTASGDVRLQESDGQVRLDTASGGLAIAEAVGPLRARTASGDVHVTASEAPSLSVQTASGDVWFEGLLEGDGPYRVETVSGDVQLTLGRPTPAAGADPDLSLAFQTVSGDARVGPIFRPAGRRTWQAGTGAGPKVAVKTVSGDLAASLELREKSAVGRREPAPAGPTAPPIPVPPPPPEPPTPLEAELPLTAPERTTEGLPNADTPANYGESASPTQRLDVLRAVERGEIDVEEALRRLDDGGAARTR